MRWVKSHKSYADVAQLAEQLICNQQVIGSSPIIGLHQTVNLNDVCWETVKLHMGGFPSGQRGQTVNLLQLASMVRIHLCPLKNLKSYDLRFLCYSEIIIQCIVSDWMHTQRHYSFDFHMCIVAEPCSPGQTDRWIPSLFVEAHDTLFMYVCMYVCMFSRSNRLKGPVLVNFRHISGCCLVVLDDVGIKLKVDG